MRNIMLNSQNFFVRLTKGDLIRTFCKTLYVSLIAIIISLCMVSPARATTQELKLSSASGYLVDATFSYDQDRAVGIIREQGKGKTKLLDTLKVSFYKPSGELMASYDNIIDGVAQGNYLEFNFDPATQQLSGNIDFGGEFAGDIYLKGGSEQELILIEVKTTGEEKMVDHIPLHSNIK